jgi:intracellular septation protein A
MSFDLALQGLLPLIVFAIVDIFAGLNAAIAAAIAVGLLEACWSWYRFGEVDQFTWISLALIMVMGLVSIRMKDARLFKFQPVVMALIFAGTLGWFQWRGEPLLLQMLPKVVTLLPADQAWMARDEMVIKRMARLDLFLIAAFIAHGAMVSWFAIRKSTLQWVLARALGFYLLAGMALLVNLVLPLK